jgi:hypothetical protein
MCKTAPDLQVVPWKSIGVPKIDNLYFNLSDYEKSSSGSLGMLLIGTGFNKCVGLNPTNLTPDLLDKLAQYYRGAYAESSSLAEFNLVKNGSIPIVITYENLPVEQMVSDPNSASSIGRLTIVNTDPTVWADHNFLARTKAGMDLMAALKDPEIQKIACEKHGFRTADCDVSKWGLKGVSPSISNSMNLPSYEVFEKILAYFKQLGLIASNTVGAFSAVRQILP